MTVSAPKRIRPFTGSPETRRDLLLVSIPVLVFLVALVPALAHAQREYRDGVRRDRLRHVKRDLEDWYNRTNAFPLPPSGDAARCGTSDDRGDWFFTGHRIEDFSRSPVHDPTNRSPFVFRYCPTARTPGDPPGATAFFLESTLENPAAERAGFNFEHNILERVLTVDGRSVYRICGGTEAQCGTVPAGS